MNFPIFKKALKFIPSVEKELKLEELKFQWKKIKMKLEEKHDNDDARKELESQKNELKNQIM